MIAVINPNSSAVVTAAIDRSVNTGNDPRRARFRCITMAAGPAGVVTQADADAAAVLTAQWIADHEQEASAFVIACFSDPGIAAARERTRKPVIGLGEAGLLAALAMGRSVGVIAVANPAIPRHLRYWRQLGLDHRVAAERALDVSVEQSGDPAIAFARMCEVGTALRDRDRADVLLLGCAGMADLRGPLQAALGVPVVDPCAAAAALAVLRADMAAGGDAAASGRSGAASQR
ncbi:MAG TPA: aspartate/glutamate racemase family protein [Burkholderiaceae bacterium]|jgi:Asp/Glu/hydantoin racemase